MKADGPDGFHSWIVAAGCCVLYLLMYGMTRISGLLFVETMSLFDVDRESSSFPYVFAVTMRYVSGPMSGFLARRIGICYVVMLGCCMAFVGVGACMFAKNIVVVTILWGVIHGMGAGFATCLIPQVVNLYFKKYTTKVYGLTYAGSSLSGFVLTPITEFLLQTYGLPGTYLILGGLILNGLAATILLKKPDFKITNSEPECQITFGNKSMKEYETNDVVVGLGYRLIPHYSLINTETSSNIKDIKDGTRKIIDVSVINHLTDSMESNNDVKINKEFNDDVKFKHEVNLKDSSKKPDAQPISQGIEPSSLDICKNGKKDSKSSLKQILDPNALSKNTDSSEFLSISKKDDTKFYKNIKRRNGIFASKDNNNYSRNESPSVDNSIDNPVLDGEDRKKSWINDITIFKDPVYISLCIGEALSTFLFVVTPTILVDYGLDKGIPVEDSAYLLMAFSVCDMSGSLSLGWIIDTGILSKAHFTAVCFCVSAASFVLLAFSTSYTMMLFGVILEGLSLGALAPIFPGIIGEYIDKTKQTVAISSIGFLYVPVSFTVSPLIGYFRDYIGSYVYMFYLMCGISITCSLLFLFMPRIAKCRTKS
ncbi:Monocarboxylate transporter 12 like protein [Argiope bruennichi]|uniref:Monocarboxylate transporter 12 like protein n=1 Tax=Argiope bruennichi TaxID=94029 RepID=A0A8T0EMG4_ARGBR|nr:Monocarboxylate transporter 12 like protein [Argiope bruennichi]